MSKDDPIMRLDPVSHDLPYDWDLFPFDPSIPDISDWSVDQITAYLSSKGFDEEVCQAFRNNKLNGSRILQMKRADFCRDIGLKLGDSVTVFQTVLRLQARRQFSKESFDQPTTFNGSYILDSR